MIGLFALILVDSISVSVVVPLLGPLLIDPHSQVFLAGQPLHLRSIVSGLLVAVYVGLMLVMAPVLGYVSDRIGRRPVLLLCGAGVVLGNLLAGLAVEYQSLALLFLGRVVGGATAASQSTALAAQVDRHDDKSAYLSYSFLFSSLGFIIGPIVAAQLSTGSLARPFYACAAIAAAAVTLLAVSFREASPARPGLDWRTVSLFEGLRAFRHLGTDRAVTKLLGCFLLMQAAWGGYFVFVSIFLMQQPLHGLTLGQVSTFMAVMGAGFCLSNGVVYPLLSRRFSMRTLAVVGLLLTAGAIAAVLAARTPDLAYATALVAGIAVNIAFPAIVTMASDRVPDDRQGWVMGMTGSAGALGWAISSLLSGIIGGFGHQLPVILAAVVMGLTAFVTLLASRRPAESGMT